MESYSVYNVFLEGVSGFFQHNCSEIHSCRMYQFIPFIAEKYAIVTIYHNLFIHLLLDNLVVSSFCLLQIKLLWMFVYKSLCGHVFPFFCG